MIYLFLLCRGVAEMGLDATLCGLGAKDDRTSDVLAYMSFDTFVIRYYWAMISLYSFTSYRKEGISVKSLRLMLSCCLLCGCFVEMSTRGCLAASHPTSLLRVRSTSKYRRGQSIPAREVVPKPPYYPMDAYQQSQMKRLA